MGIHAVAKAPRPEPKATCPSCHRPVAMMKSGKCLYCGQPLPGALQVVETRPGLPPELMFALQPRTSQITPRTKWIRRAIAMGISSLLVGLFMGPCMNMKP